jgi:hypothetical protein
LERSQVKLVRGRKREIILRLREEKFIRREADNFRR